VVKLLLDNKADMEVNDEETGTPLSYAAKAGHEAIVKLLLDKNADIEAKDYYF
jgi:ankyrin repeat protein